MIAASSRSTAQIAVAHALTSRVAFCGASGTGKSTLAEWVSDRYGLPLNPVGSRSVAQAMGFATAYDTDAAGKRSEFQNRLVREKIAWEAERGEFVTDRCTFDNLAYSMLHGARDVSADYFALACDGMQHYECVVYCPASVFIDVGSDHHRVADATYQQLYDATLWGLLQRFRFPRTRLVVMPYPQLEHRFDFLRQLMGPETGSRAKAP